MARGAHKGRKICGAKRKDGKKCQSTAIFPNGRCKLHGGRNQGTRDKTLKYADKIKSGTGVVVSIFHDCFDKEEIKIWDALETDVVPVIIEELKILAIRERRMLIRIRELSAKKKITTKVSKKTGKNMYGDELNEKEVVKEGPLKQIQAIEETLTKVQERKHKLLDLKFKIEMLDPEDKDDDALENLAEVIQESIKVARAAKKRKEAEQKKFGHLED